MTRANDVNQRVILLATDSSQSIIGESINGKINTIGYTAYGERSAQQDVATALGFNGQLREAKLGWYLLGNGYRAYNTRLMRFHSPDSWSPFGRGGLNAYMYCVGDPVNRVDPTGHMTLLKFLSKSFDFFFGGSEITGPSRSRAFAATGATGRRMSVEHGDLAALGAAGGAVAARSPTVVTTGRYPSMGDGSTHGMNWGNTPSYVPNRQASPMPTSNSLRRADGRSSVRPTESGPPPSYDQATSHTKPWNYDTFAQAQTGRTFNVYRVAAPDGHYGSLHPPPMEHPQLPNLPARPTWQRSPTPSPASSRDSTPPRSRNPSGSPPHWGRDDTTLTWEIRRR